MNEAEKEGHKKAAAKASPTRSHTKTVEIKIALPTMPDVPAYTKLKYRVDNLPKRTKTTISIMTAIAVISLGSYYLLAGRFTPGAPNVQATATPGLTRGTPSFPLVLPDGKNAASLNGWTNPPGSNPVFVYIDKLKESQINVSQQPLPDDFKNDTEQKVAKLAQESQAREKITIGNTIVHIHNSGKGPQSVIFSKQNLFIVTSDTRIDNNQWAEYINSLR